MKPITMYVSESLYDSYQINALKQGKKAAELIRDAMELYAHERFNTKKKLSSLDLSKGVRSQVTTQDFLTDENWKMDLLDDATDRLSGDAK